MRPAAPDRRLALPRPGPARPASLVRRPARPGARRRTAPLAEDMLRVREPGSEIRARLRMRGAEPCLWRGVWLEDGLARRRRHRPRDQFESVSLDGLTGLLDRRSFVIQSREKITHPGGVRACGRRPRPPAAAQRGARPRARRPCAGRAGLAPGRRLLRRTRCWRASARTSSRCWHRSGDACGADTLRAALEQPLRVAGFDISPDPLYRRGQRRRRRRRAGGRRAAAPGRAGGGSGQDRRARRGGGLRPGSGERRPLAPGHGSRTCAAPSAAARS